MFKGIIHNFKDKEQFDSIFQILQSIHDKTDQSLRFDSQINLIGDFLINVYDDDKDQLHRRCSWIIHKLDSYNRLIYEVEQCG